MGEHRNRRRYVLIGVLVLVGLVVVVIRNVWLTDSSEAVPVEAAVDRYRSESSEPVQTAPAPPGTVSAQTVPAGTVADESVPTSIAPPASLPEPGVYRYRTTGGESIDAIGGVNRDYPAETTITVTTRGCGVHLSWNPLEERRDEWDLCVSDRGVELQSGGVQFHEFFGQAQIDDISCDGVVSLIDTEPVPAPAVDRTCTLAADPWNPVWQVLDRGSRQVDGGDVAVTHVRMTVEDDDEYWEHTIADWYLAASGLPVAVSVDTSSRSPSMVGAVVYHETYELQLESMSPLT